MQGDALKALGVERPAADDRTTVSFTVVTFGIMFTEPASGTVFADSMRGNWLSSSINTKSEAGHDR